MTTQEPGPAERLAELLETAPPEVRREIVAWLLRTQGQAPVGGPWPPVVTLPPHAHEDAPRMRNLLMQGLTGNLPPTVDSQVVTVRLPATRHAALRDWCN